MTIISTRQNEETFDLNLSKLSFEELELIAALLYNTTLGNNVSIYRDAAFSLLTKIEWIAPTDDFLLDASKNVNVCIKVMDDDCNEIDIIDSEHFEILV